LADDCLLIEKPSNLVNYCLLICLPLSVCWFVCLFQFVKHHTAQPCSVSQETHTALSAGQHLLEKIGGQLLLLRQCRIANAFEVDALPCPQWFDIPRALWKPSTVLVFNPVNNFAIYMIHGYKIEDVPGSSEFIRIIIELKLMTAFSRKSISWK